MDGIVMRKKGSEARRSFDVDERNGDERATTRRM